VAPDQRFQLADELSVATEGQIDLDPLLEPDQTQLLEPCDLLLSKCLVREIGQWRPAPKAKGVAEDLGGGVRSSFGECGSCLIEQGPEPVGVELTRIEPKRVPGWPRQEGTSGGLAFVAAIRAERPAKL
jgi:hypothetical protein